MFFFIQKKKNGLVSRRIVAIDQSVSNPAQKAPPVAVGRLLEAH